MTDHTPIARIVEALESGLEWVGQYMDHFDCDPNDPTMDVCKAHKLIESALAAARAMRDAEPVAIGEIDASDDGYFVELYPDRDLKLGAKVYTAPPPVAKVAEPVAWAVCHEGQPILLQIGAAPNPLMRTAGTVRPLVWGDTAPPPASVGAEPMDDTSLRALIFEAGNRAHNLSCEYQNNEALARRLGDLAVYLWDLARKASAAPPPVEASQQQASGEYRIKVAPELKDRLEARIAQISEWPDYMQRAAQQQAEPASGEASQLLRDIDDLIEDAELSGWHDRSAYKLAKAAHAKLAAELSRLTAELDVFKEENADLYERIANLNSSLSSLTAELSAAKAADANTKLQAESYEIACEVMEGWQDRRIAEQRDPGTRGSLIDGIERLHQMIEQREAEAEANAAENAALRKLIAEADAELDQGRRDHSLEARIQAALAAVGGEGQG